MPPIISDSSTKAGVNTSPSTVIVSKEEGWAPAISKLYKPPEYLKIPLNWASMLFILSNIGELVLITAFV